MRRAQNQLQPVNSFPCEVEHLRVSPQELRASHYRDVMRCLFCKDKLADGLRPTARYCDTNCRSGAYRARQREMLRIPQGRVTARKLVRDPGHHHADLVEIERLLSTASDRIIAALRTGGSASQPYRVRMDTQVLSQAPAGAAGYRLVLPASREGARPRLIPQRGAEQLSCYALSPFQAPDDLRLRDGCWYRIVWVDATGRSLPSSGGATIPDLYYFVGPPASETLATAGATACDDALQASVQESAAQTHQNESEAAQPAHSLAEPVAHQPSASEPAAEQVDPPSAPASGDQAQETADVPAQPDSQADEIASHSSSEPAPLAINTAMDPSDPVTALSPGEIKQLCAIICDVEEFAQLQYEIFRRDTERPGTPPPVEPRTLLSGEKRKELRRVVADRRLFWAYISLSEKFTDALRCSEDASLPAPFQPLGQKTRDRAKEALGTKEHRSYTVSLLRRAYCLMRGQPVPPEPETRLPAASRQALKKLLQDRRVIEYLARLAEQTSQTSDPTSSPSRHTEA